MNNKKNFYCVSSRVENTGQLYGCFKIGPFFGHQGLTFANVLRRSLLADQSRATFNAIQIYGVEHEFSSLIGVREPVVDILLNLEKLIFQSLRPITKPQVAFVNFCGPGILRAQHLHLPMSLKCVIPSQYIATVEVDGQLAFKLFFSPNLNKFQPLIQNINPSHYKKIQTNSTTIFGFKKPAFVNKLQKRINKKRKTLNSLLQPGQKPYSSFKKREAISFTQQIQENFLFLKSSSCAIHKVNYTVQSHTTTELDISNRKFNKSNSHEKFHYGFKLSKPKSLEISSASANVVGDLLEAPADAQAPSPTTFQAQTKWERELEAQTKWAAGAQAYAGATAGTTTGAGENIESKEVIIPILSRLSPKAKKKESSKKEEFVLFEIWTDGSLHPQTAILKAINELLLDIFPYSFQISKYEKIHTKSLKFQQIKRKDITDLSKKHFREKFLNLEVGNFHFDLETYLFLKKKKIYRVIDFLNFFSKKETLKATRKIKITLSKFYVFILSSINNENQHLEVI